MRAVVYARVSTSNHGQDPQVQLREIAEYCSRRGWAVTSEYVDVGISGTKEASRDRRFRRRSKNPKPGFCPTLTRLLCLRYMKA